MKFIKLGGNPYHIGAVYSRHHSFMQKSMKYFDKAEHPFAKSMLGLYIEKKKEPLWLSSDAHGAAPFPNKKSSWPLQSALALRGEGHRRE